MQIKETLIKFVIPPCTLLNDYAPFAVVALRSLKDEWQNTPPSWDRSDDPCGEPWEGVTCNKSRVTSL